MYRQMKKIRLFEEQVDNLYRSAKMPGLAHLYTGEEGVAVGVCSALRRDDYITSTHRGHGHCLAKGAEIDRMFAELLGKEAGYCKGKGGSMHIADHANGNLGANAIVGGSTGIATGAAFSAKRRGTDQVSVCFIGEGALGQGILYEVMNMSSLWSLPVIYVCENNLYNEYTHYLEATAGDVLDRPRAFGIHALDVDGQDVRAVYASMKGLVGRARRGEGPAFKVLSGLVEEFGPERVLDSPISEAGITGLGVGAAMTGLRPIVDIMFGDFLTLVMDQLVNQAAKVHYMSGGKLKAPLVLRTTLGATRRSAAQHSQSLQAWVSHVPGLKVAIPSTPYDAKGLLKTAIRDDNPVVFIEDKLHYPLKGEVPVDEYLIALGEADVKREGDDVTIVATSSMVQVSLAAAELLEKDGISAEVVDPRTTTPLDAETLVRSVEKTGRAIVVHEGPQRYGVTAEPAAVIAQRT